MTKARLTCSLVAMLGLFMTVLPHGATAHRPALHLTYITTDRGLAAAIVENGARQAAADLGVTLAYEQLRSADPAKVAARIDTVVGARTDGLVFAVDDLGALDTAIEAAAAMGIPILSVGPEGDAPRSPGIVLHIDRDETIAGIAAGRQLGKLGVTNALCLKVDVGDPADSRCSGAAAGLAEGGGAMDLLTAIDPAGDPSGIRGAVAARLRADPAIDGILMTDAASTSQTLGAITQAGRHSSLTLAAFDIGADVLDALEAGEMAFAVDQQPYLEGYLAVMSLALFARDGLLPGGGEPLLVGSVMVTQEDAARVRQLERQGIR